MRNHEQVPENRHCTSNAPLLAFAHEISSMLDGVIEQLRRRRQPVLVLTRQPAALPPEPARKINQLRMAPLIAAR
jgi:hypothetical protein